MQDIENIENPIKTSHILDENLGAGDNLYKCSCLSQFVFAKEISIN